MLGTSLAIGGCASPGSSSFPEVSTARDHPFADQIYGLNELFEFGEIAAVCGIGVNKYQCSTRKFFIGQETYDKFRTCAGQLAADTTLPSFFQDQAARTYEILQASQGRRSIKVNACLGDDYEPEHLHDDPVLQDLLARFGLGQEASDLAKYFNGSVISYYATPASDYLVVLFSDAHYKRSSRQITKAMKNLAYDGVRIMMSEGVPFPYYYDCKLAKSGTIESLQGRAAVPNRVACWRKGLLKIVGAEDLSLINDTVEVKQKEIPLAGTAEAIDLRIASLTEFLRLVDERSIVTVHNIVGFFNETDLALLELGLGNGEVREVIPIDFGLGHSALIKKELRRAEVSYVEILPKAYAYWEYQQTIRAINRLPKSDSSVSQ